jgi:hypothetical protein
MSIRITWKTNFNGMVGISGHPRARISIVEDVAAEKKIARTNLLTTTIKKHQKPI